MSSIKNMPIHVDINVYYKKKKKRKGESSDSEWQNYG